MNVDVLLHVIARFLHIGSAILLLGGVWYARVAMMPSLILLPTGELTGIATVVQQRFRATLYTVLTLSVLTGFYNYFTYAGPRHSSGYQMWFGLKFLLVLHVLATAILWSTSATADGPSLQKGNRRLLSLIISGFAIVAISAYLRSLTLRGL